MNHRTNQTKHWIAGAFTAGVLTAGLLLFNPAATATFAVQDAATLFKTKCASCHGVDGSGNTPSGKSMKLRDLRSPEVQKLTDQQLTDITAKGKGKMPGYEKSLGMDKVKQLVAYMRELGKKK